MTPLRQRMIEDIQVRNLSPHTQASYVQQVSLFARHFHRPPEQLGPEEIRSYQVYLTNDKKLAPGSVLIAVAALRFLYKVTLKKDWRFDEIIPVPKKPQTLPVGLSPSEVVQFLDSVASRKHRVILTTCDAAGLRISEAVRLTLPAIDSARMVVRVDHGKGQNDRYVMLSPKRLDILRDWWRVHRPAYWLFPGGRPGQPITRNAVEDACQQAHRRCDIPKPITPHSLRHAFAVPVLESGTDVRKIQRLLGHRSLATTARYLRGATSPVCATSSPLDLLPRPLATEDTPPTAPAFYAPGRMARPTLEVADVFRRYGDAYRHAQAGALSTAQRRLMGAIEACRTAALGGHVEPCDRCRHDRICYRGPFRRPLMCGRVLARIGR